LKKPNYLTGKQTGMGEKLLRRLREEGRIEYLPSGVMGRGYRYEEDSYLKYLESQAQKAKPPELPFEFL
jgi:hypothetical protein